VRSLTRPPLVVQRALYFDDAVPDMAFVYLANPTAGLLQGDALQIEVCLSPGARAHVTTQAATKVFSMPDGWARQSTSLALGPGAYLEYLPDPIIPYHGSRLCQVTSIAVAADATLIYAEIVAPGRAAMGESLAFACYRNRLTVSNPDGRPLYHEAFTLAPEKRTPRGLGVLGSKDPVALGTLLVVTGAARAVPLLEGLRAAMHGAGSVSAGASLLPEGSGVGLKVLAPEVAPVRGALHAAWEGARRQILGVGAPALRKY
jgi:urease accessory protein